ncbi:hypothetical protein GCAAIG_09050 [Candidatus Electronema halotolerans]
MKHFRLFVIILVSSACVAASTAYSGNLLLMIAPLLGKHSSSPEPLSHQALLVGPLSGTSIKAFTIEELASPVEGPKEAVQSNRSLLAAGTFDLALAGLADNEWIVAEASGGKDIDADSNGIADASSTQNLGTLHALARASDWRTKHLKITPLTEIGWRYVENLISAVSAEEVEIRLADLARYLIKSDIDGNGTIDWNDILAFDPEKAADRDKLAFDYDWLSTANDVGQTILASLRAGETDAMLAQLDETFSWLMTRFPVPDSRYHTVQVTLSVFGPGKAASGAPHSLSVDSTLADPVYEDHIFVSEDESGTITFTATAGADAQILGWSGCENVSADLTQCTVALNRSQSVVANFGRTETILNGVVHNLSSTSNTVGTNTVSVRLSDDMNDLIDELAAANVGDFIVGDDGGGFLRKITGIKKISSTSYQFDTADAALDEVIAQGTGHIFKQMTNGDLEGYTEPAAAGLPATISPTAFSGLEGTSLQVSDQPDNTHFVIKLGEEPAVSSTSADGRAISQSLKVTLYDDGHGGTLSATGEITLDISIDVGVDYKLFDGLQGFKFIVKADSEQKVELTASQKLTFFNKKKIKIGTIPLKSIDFMIGFVPVWITPSVDIYFFIDDGSIEIKSTFGISVQEKMQRGMLYNKNTGFSRHKSFSQSVSPLLSTITTELNASIRGGLLIESGMKIYNLTGPEIPLKAYVKIEGSESFSAEGCVERMAQILAGIEAEFNWDIENIDIGAGTKIGKLLHLDKLKKLNFAVYTAEWPIKKWTFENSCPEYTKGSFLLVEGDGIFSTIDVGDASGLASNLTISNTGDEDLHWNTTNGSAAISITPSSGVLAPGEDELVQLSVATADLPVGRYLRKPFFYNEASVGQNLPDEELGNTYKTVDIDVNDLEPTDTPTLLDSVDGSTPGQASLDWTFMPETSEPWMGFQIFALDTSAADASEQLLETRSIYDRHAVISGLTPGSDYVFKMQAYSNNNSRLGPFSNEVSAHIAGTPPPASATTPLNDTGITWSGNYKSGNNTACIASSTPDDDNVVAEQDCSHGRDATNNDDSDGHAGFSYTKLDSNGVPLDDQSADYATTPWACVKDNVTGLIWEVKTDDGGLHDKDDTYTWYNTDPTTNGGADGSADYGGNTCYEYDSSNPSKFCNTQAYVNRVNAAGWCGASDWRMPTRKELNSIVHHGSYNPAIDINYFPNTVSSEFWSGSPYANGSDDAWSVYFYNGDSGAYLRHYDYAVRLVRGGQ